MKRAFKCSKCGDEFEIEADHFVPGVSGTIVTSDGVKHEYVDPTGDHKCLACVYETLFPFLNKKVRVSFGDDDPLKSDFELDSIEKSDPELWAKENPYLKEGEHG